jgi:hypothetical protein
MTATPDDPATDQSEVPPALIEDVTVEVAGDDVPLASLMQDIETAHKELDEYKNGSLVASEALDEKIAQATINGNEELKELLIDVKDAAFGVYLRVQYGDLELLGNRNPDAEYHGYFSDD